MHGAFVADHEVQQVVEFLKQSGQPSYAANVLETQQTQRKVNVDDAAAGDGDNKGDSDPLIDQAKKIVSESKRISASGPAAQARRQLQPRRPYARSDGKRRPGRGGLRNGTREVLKH